LQQREKKGAACRSFFILASRREPLSMRLFRHIMPRGKRGAVAGAYLIFSRFMSHHRNLNRKSHYVGRDASEDGVATFSHDMSSIDE
jgi:hypothetical protein